MKNITSVATDRKIEPIMVPSANLSSKVVDPARLSNVDLTADRALSAPFASILPIVSEFPRSLRATITNTSMTFTKLLDDPILSLSRSFSIWRQHLSPALHHLAKCSQLYVNGLYD